MLQLGLVGFFYVMICLQRGCASVRIHLKCGHVYYRYDQRRITPLEEVLFELNSDLVSELKHLSNSGRIGAIRAVVSAGDIGLLCKPLAVESSHLTQGR